VQGPRTWTTSSAWPAPSMPSVTRPAGARWPAVAFVQCLADELIPIRRQPLAVVACQWPRKAARIRGAGVHRPVQTEETGAYLPVRPPHAALEGRPMWANAALLGGTTHDSPAFTQDLHRCESDRPTFDCGRGDRCGGGAESPELHGRRYVDLGSERQHRRGDRSLHLHERFWLGQICSLPGSAPKPLRPR
jgi:hypothetical protein